MARQEKCCRIPNNQMPVFVVLIDQDLLVAAVVDAGYRDVLKRSESRVWVYTYQNGLD